MGGRKKRTEIHKYTAEDAQVKRIIESTASETFQERSKEKFGIVDTNFEALCVEEVLPTHSWKLSTFILY